MNKHTRKMIAPIIITIFVVLYYTGFAAVCLVVQDIPLPFRWFFGLIPLVLAGVMIYVLLTRIKEIRSGEEDDLGKY